MKRETMEKKIICIDITNVIPGKGGTGGGITTYALNLVKNLDDLLNDPFLKVYCLKNPALTTLPVLKNIITVDKEVNNTSLIGRLTWLYVRLPSFCRSKKVKVLHRIVPELPVVKVCNYIITMHDFMFDFYLERKKLKDYLSFSSKLRFRLFQKLGKMAVRMSDGIIVPAETIRVETQDKFKLLATKCETIHEASQYAAGDYGRPGNEFLTIGVVAGFHPHKGHLKVISVARQFVDRGFTQFKISMRGSRINESYIDDINSAIEENGLQNFIGFEPFVKDTTLQEIYSKYNLIMLLSEYEGFGLPVLEAQSFSIPVICSDIPVFREVLGDSAFYLSDSPTTDEISNLLQLITDPETYGDMVSKGSKNLQRFSWGKMAEESLAFYKLFL